MLVFLYLNSSKYFLLHFYTFPPPHLWLISHLHSISYKLSTQSTISFYLFTIYPLYFLTLVFNFYRLCTCNLDVASIYLNFATFFVYPLSALWAHFWNSFNISLYTPDGYLLISLNVRNKFRTSFSMSSQNLFYEPRSQGLFPGFYLLQWQFLRLGNKKQIIASGPWPKLLLQHRVVNLDIANTIHLAKEPLNLIN